MTNKPFFYVPQAQPCHVDADGCKHSGRLRVTIIAKKTPLHFGAGQFLYDENASLFISQLCRENDQITLPGSSFKGMLRSVFEALSGSCMPPNQSCKGHCPACSIFGFLGDKGQLRFSSFRLVEGATENLCLPQLYSHPTNVNQRRFYRHSTAYAEISCACKALRASKDKDKKGSEYYECLSPGAVLEGTIIYQNLTEEQLGGLLFALGVGWGEQIYHKLGYAKPAYLGSVHIEVTPEAMLGSLLSSEQGPQDFESLAASYYDKHKSKINGIVSLLKEAWSMISDENSWDMQTLTY